MKEGVRLLIWIGIIYIIAIFVINYGIYLRLSGMGMSALYASSYARAMMASPYKIFVLFIPGIALFLVAGLKWIFEEDIY